MSDHSSIIMKIIAFNKIKNIYIIDIKAALENTRLLFHVTFIADMKHRQNITPISSVLSPNQKVNKILYEK